MLLLDVNILVCAHREELARHREFRTWLERLVDSDQAFGVPELVLSGFLRIVTHPKIFDEPTPQEIALELVEEIRSHPSHLEVRPGARHWSIFVDLCRRTGARGNLVPDAYLAALAIESGCTWMTSDRDFKKFPGLDWSHPLD